MPWTPRTFVKHNKKLKKSPSKARTAVKQANAVLRETGDEGLAIAVANKHAKGKAKAKAKTKKA